MNSVNMALEFAVDMMSKREYDNILIPFIVGLYPEFIFIMPEGNSSSLKKLIEKGRTIIRKKSKMEGDCVLVYEGELTIEDEDGNKIIDKTIVFEIVDTEIKYFQRFYFKDDEFYTKGVLFKVYDEDKTTGYEEC